MRTHSHLHRPPLLLWVVTHLQTPKFKMSHYRLPAGLPAAKQTKPVTDNPNCTRSDENLIGAIDTAREQTASHGRSPVCRQANEASCRADWVAGDQPETTTYKRRLEACSTNCGV